MTALRILGIIFQTALIAKEICLCLTDWTKLHAILKEIGFFVGQMIIYQPYTRQMVKKCLNHNKLTVFSQEKRDEAFVYCPYYLICM